MNDMEKEIQNNLEEASSEKVVESPLNESKKRILIQRKTKLLWSFTLLIAIFGLAWFLLWLSYLQFHMDTDDAYANGNIVNVNAAIPGSVIAFYADNTDFVERGQLLVELDPIYYQVEYDKALASLAAQAIQLKQYSDDAKTAQANLDIKGSYLAKAQYNYNNRSQLVDSQAISQEDFTHSKDDLTIAEGEYKKAEFQLKAAQDILGSAPLEHHPLIEEKKAAVKEAYYNLKHTSLYAPITGHVAKRAVNVGQSVTRTSELLAIIPSDYVWVDANFKETELTHMRVGQPASVHFDMYGSQVKYEGKVLGIASGSGSIFSLIPPQNATGNWIKIVQRLPVRISLDPEVLKKYPVRLGLSAKVTVDTTDRNLPMLTTIPPSKPVASTNVYDIDFSEVNEQIEQIVQSNLAPERKE